MREKKLRVVLTAGGTGGHVFPAQALALELTSSGHEVFVFSDGRGSQFKDKSIKTITISAGRLEGSFARKLTGGLALLKGMGSSLHHLRRLKPDVVVGFGGYTSFPTMVAALTLRIPTIVHQADAYFGRANRLFAPFVTRIATSFPHVDNIPRGYQKKIVFTGLPIRADIQPSPYKSSDEKESFNLLVTGGSQGAKIFGEVLPKAIALLEPALQKRLQISQQCRPEFLELTQALYKNTKARVELSPFLESMGERYKKAHLIISRAGASSVVEASTAGRPALFVPYPYAMDDHQFYNAGQAVAHGGGWLIRDKDFTASKIQQTLLDLLTSPWKLEQAAENIKSVASPEASKKLAQLVVQLAN